MVTFVDVPVFPNPDESITVFPPVSSKFQCATVVAAAAAGNAAARTSAISTGTARLM